MAKYYAHEAVIEFIHSYRSSTDVAFHMEKHLHEIPAADVRPVVRGKWEVGGMFDDIGRCSCCHYMFPLDTAMTEFHFCPNCGAMMEGKGK